MNDEKICPLLTNCHKTEYCQGEDCAWYCEQTQRCAIAHLGYLTQIAKGVKKNG